MWVVKVSNEPNKNMKTFIVIAQLGMTPFFNTTSLREAKKASRQAKQLGLSGEIVVREK